MKTIFYFLSIVIFVSSCSIDEGPNYEYRILPIENATAPQKFILNSVDTLKLQYKLPTACYRFNNVYYQYQDTTRIVAINTLYNEETTCTALDSIYSYNVLVNVKQREDYVFKLWKGNDANGSPMYDEIIVPVEDN